MNHKPLPNVYEHIGFFLFVLNVLCTVFGIFLYVFGGGLHVVFLLDAAIACWMVDAKIRSGSWWDVPTR